MDTLIEQLKRQHKETLLCIIYELMLANKFSFEDLAVLHTQNLERLMKGESQKLSELRSKVIGLWVGNKKDIGDNLTTLMREAKEEGWVNIKQEQIDNSKWNKNSKNKNNK